MHEKRLYTASAFLTLTYDDKHLPARGSLQLRDLQLFMKRLRLQRANGLRFFGCGEYGGVTQRPHYHVLLFNTDFDDKRFLKSSETGHELYRSGELSKLWSSGDSYIGSVDFRSCCYVAGYVSKKVGQVVDYGDREPEFRVMSRRPGVGAVWYERYRAEAYRHDAAVMLGREVPLPRYYDLRLARDDEGLLERVKRSRRSRARAQPKESSERRRVLELAELKKIQFWHGDR